MFKQGKVFNSYIFVVVYREESGADIILSKCSNCFIKLFHGRQHDIYCRFKKLSTDLNDLEVYLFCILYFEFRKCIIHSMHAKKIFSVKNETTYMLRIRKSQVKVLVHIMRRESLNNLTLIGKVYKWMVQYGREGILEEGMLFRDIKHWKFWDGICATWKKDLTLFLYTYKQN